MTDLYATLTSIEEMTMPNDNLLGEITNEEEALEAVRQNGLALEFVPKKLRTPELCLEAVNSVFARVFKNVPEALRDEVRRALKTRSNALPFPPCPL